MTCGAVTALLLWGWAKSLGFRAWCVRVQTHVGISAALKLSSAMLAAWVHAMDQDLWMPGTYVLCSHFSHRSLRFRTLQWQAGLQCQAQFSLR